MVTSKGVWGVVVLYWILEHVGIAPQAAKPALVASRREPFVNEFMHQSYIESYSNVI